MNPPFFYTPNLDDFQQRCSDTVSPQALPLAERIEKGIPIYQASHLQAHVNEAMKELAFCLDKGPGVFVIKQGFSETASLDCYQQVIDRIIAREKQSSAAKGDHFAEVGANDRVWNALQKCCLEEPEAHIDYYRNAMVALAATAWLGPCYQITSQINVVKPGGKAQMPHRDYHLGFQGDDQSSLYPIHSHRMSAYLTLQGAVAQSDMPLASGPTLLLPYSQRYEFGYLSWRRQEFIDYFDEHAVQLALEKGDMLFFNPALFHGAGNNVTTDLQRCANLLQISSAFGIPMETIDREQMSLACYAPLSRLYQAGALSQQELLQVIAATADGYSFSTNLDKDQPLEGLAPQTMQQLMWESLSSQQSLESFQGLLAEMMARRSA